MGRLCIEIRSREGREQRDVEKYLVSVDLDAGARVLLAIIGTDRKGRGEEVGRKISLVKPNRPRS
jgi:hypothetical protein